MPKPLFYLGTAFCLFLALSAAATVGRELESGSMGFVAVHGSGIQAAARSGWLILVALLAGLAVAAILVRMATLLAARNLYLRPLHPEIDAGRGFYQRMGSRGWRSLSRVAAML